MLDPTIFEDAHDSKYSAMASNVSHVINQIISGGNHKKARDILRNGVDLIEEFLIEDTDTEYEPENKELKPSYDTLRMYCIAKPILESYSKSVHDGVIIKFLSLLKNKLEEWSKSPNNICNDRELAKKISDFFQRISEEIYDGIRIRRLNFTRSSMRNYPIL